MIAKGAGGVNSFPLKILSDSTSGENEALLWAMLAMGICSSLEYSILPTNGGEISLLVRQMESHKAFKLINPRKNITG